MVPSASGPPVRFDLLCFPMCVTARGRRRRALSAIIHAGIIGRTICPFRICRQPCSRYRRLRAAGNIDSFLRRWGAGLML